MEKLSFKTFIWPQNPHTYKEEFIREPRFVTSEGVPYYVGMGDMQRIVTGSGTFFGETAYEDFRRLAALFAEETPGALDHPLWGLRYCYFTGLELTQEPKENCVSYRFTFTGSTVNGQVPK